MNKRKAISNLLVDVADLAIAGLLTDGAHHKQWYLEEILKVLGCDLEKIKEELKVKDGDWLSGIAP